MINDIQGSDIGNPEQEYKETGVAKKGVSAHSRNGNSEFSGHKEKIK